MKNQNLIEVAQKERDKANKLLAAGKDASAQLLIAAAAERAVTYRTTGTVVMFENGGRMKIRDRRLLAEKQREYAAALAKAPSAVREYLAVDKAATRAASALVEAEYDDLDTAEDHAEETALAVADSLGKLKGSEAAQASALIALKNDIASFADRCRRAYPDKIGIRILGEDKLAWTTARPFGAENNNCVGNKINVTYKKVDGKIIYVEKA